MIIGVLEIDLFLEDCQSLKGRRAVLKGLVTRLRRTFNVAVSEVGEKNLWQRATLAVAGISDDPKYLDGLLSVVLKHFERERSVQVIDHRSRLF